MQNRIWAFLLAFIVGMGVTVGFTESAKADTGDATGAMVRKDLKMAEVSQKFALSANYENADEAAPPGASYEMRLFWQKMVRRHVRVNGRWRWKWVPKWVPIGELGTTLDAGEHFGFTSKRRTFIGTYKVRGEVWRGGTLVADREMTGDAAGTVRMPLVFGQFIGTGGTTGPEKGTLSIYDAIEKVGETAISFTRVQLLDPVTGAVKFEAIIAPINGTVDSKLDFTERATIPNAPLGEYKLVVVSTVPSIGNFAYTGTIFILSGQTTNIDMRL